MVVFVSHKTSLKSDEMEGNEKALCPNMFRGRFYVPATCETRKYNKKMFIANVPHGKCP